MQFKCVRMQDAAALTYTYFAGIRTLLLLIIPLSKVLGLNLKAGTPKPYTLNPCMRSAVCVSSPSGVF